MEVLATKPALRRVAAAGNIVGDEEGLRGVLAKAGKGDAWVPMGDDNLFGEEDEDEPDDAPEDEDSENDADADVAEGGDGDGAPDAAVDALAAGVAQLSTN